MSNEDNKDMDKIEDMHSYITFFIEDGEDKCEIFLHKDDSPKQIANMINNITSSKYDTAIMNLIISVAAEIEKPEIADKIIDEWGALKITDSVKNFHDSDEPIVKPSEFFRSIGG